MIEVLTIPSPSDGVWNLGPIPIRGYALCIVSGIVIAVWWADRRWQARGGLPGQVADVSVWAVIFGLIGARIYHVMTDWHSYFGEGGSPIEALYVWRGGLGVWGAVALGAVGAWYGARRVGVPVVPMLDTMAPTVLVAQAAGRWGNWFNQELFGRPTDLPWALEIDRAHRPAQYLDEPTFHPTFLYESLWALAGVFVVLWLERRLTLGRGRVVAVYVMVYTAGRGWIEMMRTDPVQMSDVLGLRLNVWTSIVLFVLAALYFAWATKHRPGREQLREGRLVSSEVS